MPKHAIRLATIVVLTAVASVLATAAVVGDKRETSARPAPAGGLATAAVAPLLVTPPPVQVAADAVGPEQLEPASDSVLAMAVEPALEAAQRDRLDRDLWRQFESRFVTAEGRVVDNANGDISHSEGQGYGMLLAAYAGDAEAFRRIWSWTETELLIRDDGLAAWRWEPEAEPHVTDPNNATDGDILIAWALMLAAERFDDRDYRDRAAEIAAAVYEHATEETAFGRILLPGVAGFREADRKDGPIVNLSYWVFPAFASLQSAQPDLDWDAVHDAGLKLLKESRFGKKHLPTDWISLGGEAPVPANGFEPAFAYNAIRIPLYLAWADAGERELLAPFMALWSDRAAAIQTVDVRSGKGEEPLTGAGYRSVAALVACAMEGEAVPDDLRAPAVDLYYPTTLQALSLIAAGEAHSGCR